MLVYRSVVVESVELVGGWVSTHLKNYDRQNGWTSSPRIRVQKRKCLKFHHLVKYITGWNQPCSSWCPMSLDKWFATGFFRQLVHGFVPMVPWRNGGRWPGSHEKKTNSKEHPDQRELGTKPNFADQNEIHVMRSIFILYCHLTPSCEGPSHDQQPHARQQTPDATVDVFLF